MEKSHYQHKIIFFDGVCVLCNRVVDFLLKHDRKKFLKFAALQSELAKSLVRTRENSPDEESVIYFDSGKIFYRSDAVIRIADYLGFPYSSIKIACLLPVPVRDAIYNYIARKRYHGFGKRDSCRLPDEETRGRILSVPDDIPGAGEENVKNDDQGNGGKTEKN